MSDVHDSIPSHEVSAKEPNVDDTVHQPSAARASGSREPHRVKFAEERNLYVNCDRATGLCTTDRDLRTWTALGRGLMMSQGKVNETITRPSIIRTPRPRAPTTEDSDNPFTRGGELSRKADFILRHSTFSRTALRIFDPDCVESLSATDDEAVDPLPLLLKVSNENDSTLSAEVNQEEEGGVRLSDGENCDEPCSVTTSLVESTDRDRDRELNQVTVDNQLARLNGKHSKEWGTRGNNSRRGTYESSSPPLDLGTVRTRTKTCSCCLLQ